jgi:hypothetical protein
MRTTRTSRSRWNAWACVLALAASSCASTDEIDGGDGAYALPAVQLEGMGPLADGSLRVLYRPPVENLFTCPGVDVAEDGDDTLRVSFVRTPRSGGRAPEIAGVTDPNTGVAQVILVGAASKRVVLVGGEWEREIWRKGGPIR